MLNVINALAAVLYLCMAGLVTAATAGLVYLLFTLIREHIKESKEDKD